MKIHSIHIKWNIIFWNQGVKETSASLQATSFELFFFLNYFNFGKLTESRTAYFGLPVFNISSRAVYFPSTSFSLFSIKVETPVSGQALNKNWGKPFTLKDLSIIF